MITSANKVLTKKAIAAIKREQKKIAKARDVLRDIIDELEEITDCSTDAVENLTYAVDRLSEQL